MRNTCFFCNSFTQSLLRSLVFFLWSFLTQRLLRSHTLSAIFLDRDRWDHFGSQKLHICINLTKWRRKWTQSLGIVRVAFLQLEKMCSNHVPNGVKYCGDSTQTKQWTFFQEAVVQQARGGTCYKTWKGLVVFHMKAISCLLVENSDKKIQEILSAVFLAPKFLPQLERLFLYGFCI